MTDKAELLRQIATEATGCWTCGGEPNPANFGGLCDPCSEAKTQRLSRSRVVLEQHGRTNTQEYRALRHLGY